MKFPHDMVARCFGACAAVVLFAAPFANAAIYYWDGNDGTAGFGAAAGTWAGPTTGTTTSGWSTDSTGATVVNGNSVTTATTDTINFGSGTTGLAAGTITVSGTVDAGNMTFAYGSGAILLSGGTINLAAAQTTTVDNATDTINSSLTGASTSFTKAGTGALVLTGSSSYTGTTIIKGGSLIVDNNSGSGSLSSGSGLTFSGAVGIFNYKGAASGSALSLAALNFSAGDGTVQSTYGTSGNTNITFSSLGARTTGAVGNFAISGGSIGSTNKIVITGQSAGYIDKGIYFNSADFAAYDSGGFVRAYSYATDSGAVNFFANATTLGAVTASSHVRLAANITAQTNATVGDLKFDGARTLTLATTATLGVNGIVKSGGGIGSLIGTTASGTTQIVDNGGSELTIRTATMNDTFSFALIGGTNSSYITMNGSGATTISGPGFTNFKLVANNSTGGINVLGGLVMLQNTVANSLGTNNLNINGGLIQVYTNAGITRNLGASASQMQITGGASGFSGAGTVTFTSAATTLQWGTSTFNPSSFILGQTSTLANPMDFNGSTRILEGILGSSGASAGVFSGVISNSVGGTTAGLIKNSSGEIQLTNTNTFNGGVVVNGGTLSYSVAANGGLNSSLGKSSNLASNLLLGSGTTLKYIGTTVGSTDRGMTINGTTAGAAATLDASGTSTNTITYASTGALAYGTTNQTRRLTLTGTNTSANTFALQITDNGTGAVGLTKGSTGQWVLTNNNTYTGTTLVNNGTLTLSGVNGAIASSAVTINGGSLTVSNTSAANNTNRISSSAFTMNGGTFNYNNDASNTTFSEGIGALTIGGGDNTVAIQQSGASGTSTLTFASLSRTIGTVNFSGAGLGASADTRGTITFTAPPSFTNYLGPWATVNGTSFATLDGSNNVVAYTGHTDVTRQASGTKAIADNAAADVRIIEGTGGAANITLGSTTTTINTLLQSISGGTGATTVDIATGQTLRVSSISAVATSGALTLGTAANTGTLTAASSGGNLLLINSSANTMTVNSVIANNGTASSLTVDGTGTISLAGTNTYTGALTLNGGTLSMAAVANLGSPSSITFAGNSTLSSTASGGTTTIATAIINSGVTARFDKGGAGGGGTFTFTNGVSGSGTLSFTTNSGGSGNGTLNLNNSSSFTGTVELASDYATNGATTINASGLGDGGKIRHAGTAVALTFNYSGSAVTFNTRQLEMASSQSLTFNNNGTGAVVFNTPLSVTATGDKTLTLGGSGTGFSNILAGQIADGTGYVGNSASISITKAADASNWILSNANNTFTGAITISGTTGATGVLAYASANGANGANNITFTTTTGSATLRYIGSANQTMSGSILAAAQTTGTITLDASGPGTVNYSNTAPLSAVTATAKTLVLGGSGNAGTNIFSGQWVGTTAILTKSGASTWAITNSNTYTGGTNVNGGTLLLSGAVNMPTTGTLQVNAGGAFSLADGTASATTTTAKLGLASGAALVFDWNGSSVDTITSTASATTAGSVGIIINSSSPTGSGGTLISSSAGGLTTAGSTRYFLANNTNFTASLTVSDTAVSIGSQTSVAALTNAYWIGGQVTNALGAMAYSSGSNSNWATNAAGASASGVVPGGSTVNIIFGATGATQQSSVTTGADMNLGSITFNDSTAVTIGGSNYITLNSTSSTAASTSAAGATVTAGSAISVTSFANAANTISANLNLAASQTWNIASGKTLTVSGAVSGYWGAGLTMGDSGTLVLSGANTYFGTTNIAAGTLQVGAGSTTGSLSLDSAIVISSGATLAFNRSDAITQGTQFGRSISGNGGVTQMGSGTTTLSAPNTYLGTTTVSRGTLQITGSINGTTGTALAFGGTGILNVNEAAASAQHMTSLAFNKGDGTVQSTFTGTSANLTFDAAPTFATGGVGVFIVSAGTIGTANTNANGTLGTNNIILTGQTGQAFMGVNYFAGTTSGSSYAFYDGAGFVRPLSYTADATPASASTFSGAQTSLTGTNVQLVSGGSVSAQATTALNSLNIINSAVSTAQAYTLTGGATLTIDGILRTGNITGLASATTISGGTALQASTNNAMVIRTDLANDFLTISTPIIANGTNALVKSGAGTLTLQGANTFSGNIYVNGGFLIIGSPTNTSVSGKLTSGGTAGTYSSNIFIGAGATLSVRSSDSQILNGVISGDGSLFKGGNGTLTLSGNNTYTGTTQVAPIASGVTGGVLSISSFNSVFTNAALGTVHSDSSSLGAPTTVANGTITIGQAVASSATLRYTGTGETTDRILNFNFNSGGGHTLDAANTAGLLKFVSAFTGGGSAGTLTLTNSVSTGNGEVANTIPNFYASMPLTKSGTGTWTLSGANTYTGATTIFAGMLVAGTDSLASQNGAFGNASSAIVLGSSTANTAASDAPTLLINGAFTVGRDITVGSVANTNAYNATIGGSNTTGTSTYSGNITLNTTASVYTFTMRAATGGTTDFTTGTWTTNNKTVNVGSSGNTGIVRLSNTMSTTGAVNVNYGTFQVNGTLGGAGSTLAVASGATLSGTGTINSSITILSGGFINPGNSFGTLNTGNLTQAGLYTAEIADKTAGNFDQINVTGAVNITSGSLVAAFSAGTYAANDLIFILLNDSTDAITGTYTGLAQGATVTSYGGYDWNISYTADSVGSTFTGGNDIALIAVVVPEPSVALLGGLSLLGWMLRRRR